jgi:DNA-binding CsgD family transcriptional regulator
LHAADELRDVRDELDRLHAAESRLSQLTPRERDILRSLATGLSNKGVARELDLSPRTVEVHRANMVRRSGARNIAELLQMQFIVDRAPTARPLPLTPASGKPVADTEEAANTAAAAELAAQMGPQPFAIPSEPTTPSPYAQSPAPPVTNALSRQHYFRP